MLIVALFSGYLLRQSAITLDEARAEMNRFDFRNLTPARSLAVVNKQYKEMEF